MSVTGSNVYVISASRQRSSPALSRHEIPLSLTIIPAGGNTVHGPDDNARPDRNHREQQHSWLRFSPLLSPGWIGGTKRDQAKRTPKRPGFDKITIQRDQRFRVAMDLPIVSAVTGIGEKNGIPLAFQPRREFFGKFTTTRGKESREGLASMLICNCTYAHLAFSFERLFLRVWRSVLFGGDTSLHVYLNTRYKHVVNEIEV